MLEPNLSLVGETIGPTLEVERDLPKELRRFLYIVPAMPVSGATSRPSPVTLSRSDPMDTMTAGELAVGASRMASSPGVNHFGPK